VSANERERKRIVMREPTERPPFADNIPAEPADRLGERAQRRVLAPAAPNA